MNVTEIIPGKIITISDVLTSEECDEFIKVSENIGYDDAPITTYSGFVIQKDIRNNTRVMLDDLNTVNYIWQKLKSFTPETIGFWKAIGLNERLRYYRYDPLQYFLWHYDGCFTRNEYEESKLTLMIYLNDDFTGGETQFKFSYIDDQMAIKPKKGMALLFDHDLFHQGSPVITGRKYVLRSDVMYTLIDS